MKKTELTPMQNFEEKVKARLTKDIGDLIPDEALKSLIDKSIDNVFFNPRVKIVNQGSYHETKETLPSVFEETVQELVEPMFKKLVKAWIDDNSGRIGKEMNDFLNRSAEDVFVKAIGSIFSNSLYQMQMDIQTEMANKTF